MIYPWHHQILATHEEAQDTALGPWQGDDILGVALPSSKALRRKVEISCGGHECIATVLDVGPWCVDDYEYVDGMFRPRAEILKGRPCPTVKGGEAKATIPDRKGGMRPAPISNGAGIDLYPGTAHMLVVPIGKNVLLSWRFAS